MVYNTNSLTKLVSNYLPRYGKIALVTEGYQLPAIIKGDIDGDKSLEIVAMYEREGRMYIMILKEMDRRWYVIWNSKVNFKSISKFELATFKEGKKQIALGGEIDGYLKQQLMLLAWEEESLNYMLAEYKPFDKLYIQDIDGRNKVDEIIIWEHNRLEAYDTKIYCYQNGELIRDTSLDIYYTKEIRSYYEYLCENYPEESLYREYLEKFNTNIATQVQRLPEDINIFEMLGGSICEKEIEENIYITGKFNQKENYIEDFKIIFTTNNQKKYNIIQLDTLKVYEYEIFIGDFTGNGIDDLWIGTYKDRKKQEKSLSIYSYLEVGMGKILTKENILEAYPIDKQFKNRYDIEIITDKEEYGKKIKQVSWLNWKDNQFQVYRQAIVSRE